MFVFILIGTSTYLGECCVRLVGFVVVLVCSFIHPTVRSTSGNVGRFTCVDTMSYNWCRFCCHHWWKGDILRVICGDAFANRIRCRCSGGFSTLHTVNVVVRLNRAVNFTESCCIVCDLSLTLHSFIRFDSDGPPPIFIVCGG